MTVIKDNIGCNKVFVVTRRVSSGEQVTCLFCNAKGTFTESTDERFKGEGALT